MLKCKGDSVTFQSFCGRFKRAAILVMFTACVIAMYPGIARAQNCSNLAPLGGGQDDWPNIDFCLRTAPNTVTLSSGTFLISRPIVFYASNSILIGQGRPNTTIALHPTFTCISGQPNFVIDVNGQGTTKDTITIKRFKLDLASLPSNCANVDSYAVRFLRSHNQSTLQGVAVRGGTTIIGGVRVVKSKNAIVQFSDFSDVTNGIQIDDSPNVTVYSNDISRAGVGISVDNNAGADQGGEFDSSGTTVSLNNVTDVADRGIRLRSRGVGALRVRNLVVYDNDVLNFGNIGIYMVSGVQNARIENNTVSGAPTSNYGLWVGGVDPDGSVVNPCFDNQINGNGFTAGRFDVSFNGAPTGNNVAGPDQPTISRLSAGSNLLGATGIEPLPAVPCGQYAHAWWVYKNGLTYVPSGGKILLAAAGTRQFSTVTYKITSPGGNPNFPLMQFTTTVATNDVCVINQHDSPAINLAAGFYDVYVDLTDGNGRFPDPNYSDGVRITNWKLSVQLEVR